MRIEILCIEGCPNARLAAERVAVAVSRLNLDAPISTVVMTEDFAGSPTILVDGQDVCPGEPKAPPS